MASNIANSSKVSIVICTYNGEEFISEQLHSILNQTFPIEEIIVVDDRSADKTTDIIEAISKENSIITLHKNISNIGFNKNFEKALKLAKGDVIAISDQDDIWDSKKIETLMRNWVDDTLLIYCSSVRFIDHIPSNPKADAMITPIAGSNPFHLAIRNTVSGHAMMIKKELLHLALPFDPDVYYDWWLAMVAVCNGGITYVPAILVYQRGHDSNITLKKGVSSNERFIDYKRMLVYHLKKFQTIPNLTGDQKRFFYTLHHLWQQSLTKRLNFKLFVFLMKNRKALFKYKKRKIPWISSLKHSFRYSFKKSI